MTHVGVNRDIWERGLFKSINSTRARSRNKPYGHEPLKPYVVEINGYIFKITINIKLG